MIPSRGFRGSSHIIGLSRRRISLTARKFSSVQNAFTRNTTLLQKNNSFLCKTPLGSQFSRISPSIRNGATIRFASTSPITVATQPASTPIDPASAATSSPEFVADIFSATEGTGSILNIQEHIGYLKSLGLDYGWGPTSVVEWTLEHIHVLAGTPWWASITIAAVVFRIVQFYPTVLAADNGARMAAITPYTKPIQEKMKAAMASGDKNLAAQTQQELQRIYKKSGIKIWKSFTPLLGGLIGFGSWRILRGMSDLPVPGLETGGLLWFQNLAIPDPLFLLPLATSVIMHFVFKKGGEAGVSTMSPTVQKNMSYGLPLLSLAIVAWMPACLQLSFFISSILSYFQVILMQNQSLRDFFGIYPMPTKPVPTTSQPRLKIAPTAQDIIHEMPTSRKIPIFKPVTDFAQGAKKILGDNVKTATDAMGQTGAKKIGNMKKREKEEAAKYEAARQKQIRAERDAAKAWAKSRKQNHQE